MVTIPASTESTIERFGLGQRQVPEADLPWIPVGERAYIKPLRFDIAGSSHVNLMWLDGPMVVGTHRHFGEVTGYCLEGSWFYREYDWVANPGSFIYEAPGNAHTLITEHPTGMKTLFTVKGTVEFSTDDESSQFFAGTVDVYKFIELYEDHCRENGLPFREDIIF